MDAQAFWNVIGNYNKHTFSVQIVLMIFIIIALVLSYTHKINWMAKFALGVTNLFIAFGFFAMYGTEIIQKYFAFPLYLICGILFIYECWNNKEDIILIPSKFQMSLLVLYVLYPFVSMILGNSFPKMVTYIMPCPVVSLSIAVYAGYKRKNRFLLLLLTIWGLTGIKSLFFNVYEDLILLLCGIYGIVLFVKEMKNVRGR